MPVTFRVPIRRLSQTEFGEIAYELMGHVFAIHGEMGRFFNENIYKQELARRMSAVRLEEPIQVVFGSFRKAYFLDVLVAEGALFEFKAVESFAGRHQAQLLNYLLLCDLAHGKLINVRPDAVEHEFVNTQWRYVDRLKFQVDTEQWNPSLPGTATLQEYLIALLRDLGVGLETALYEAAVVDFLGGPDRVETDIAVVVNHQQVGRQRMRLIGPGVAMKITAFEHSRDGFETHARRLLAHVDLHAIAWINIAFGQVTFTTLTR